MLSHQNDVLKSIFKLHKQDMTPLMFSAILSGVALDVAS